MIFITLWNIYKTGTICDYVGLLFFVQGVQNGSTVGRSGASGERLGRSGASGDGSKD